MQHTTQRPATASGTFTIGGDLTVYRLGFGTMRLTGPGIWGPLDQIAKRHNAQPGQVALAWLLKRSSTMLPIPGTSRVKHLDEDMVGATTRR